MFLYNSVVSLAQENSMPLVQSLLVSITPHLLPQTNSWFTIYNTYFRREVLDWFSDIILNVVVILKHVSHIHKLHVLTVIMYMAVYDNYYMRFLILAHGKQVAEQDIYLQ